MEPRKNIWKTKLHQQDPTRLWGCNQNQCFFTDMKRGFGWLWRLDSMPAVLCRWFTMIHPSSQFCWGKWWWNNDETSNVSVFFPTIVICNLPIFGRAFERASECASVSQRPIQVEPSVEVHHVFCTTHSPPCLGIFASATHKIGIFGYLGNSQVSSQVIL